MAGKKDDTTESRRILDRIDQETGNDFVSRTGRRLGDHLAASDVDQKDRIEVLESRMKEMGLGDHLAALDWYFDLRRYGNGATSREELAQFLRWVQESSLRYDGSAYRTMLRNDAYWFSRLGVYVERADNTARILDVKYHVLLPDNERVGGPLDYFQWSAILRSVSALTSYHWVYRDNLKPWLIADLLIMREEMPRSLASCCEAIVRNLDAIGNAYGRVGPAQRKARSIRTGLQNSKIDAVFQRGLHEFIGCFIRDNNQLNTAINQQFLS